MCAVIRHGWRGGFHARSPRVSTRGFLGRRRDRFPSQRICKTTFASGFLQRRRPAEPLRAPSKLALRASWQRRQCATNALPRHAAAAGRAAWRVHATPRPRASRCFCRPPPALAGPPSRRATDALPRHAAAAGRAACPRIKAQRVAAAAIRSAAAAPRRPRPPGRRPPAARTNLGFVRGCVSLPGPWMARQARITVSRRASARASCATAGRGTRSAPTRR